MWQALIKRRKSVLDNKSIIIDKIKYMESQGKIKIDFKNKGETNDQPAELPQAQPAIEP